MTDAKYFDRLLGPRTMMVAGVLLTILGGVVIDVAISISGRPVVIQDLFEQASPKTFGSFVLQIIGIAPIQAGIYAVWRGWRRNLQRAEDALANDSRPAVLYLRTFLSDGTPGKNDFNILQNTSQARLAAALRKIGPCITIENPRTDLPEPGFKRLASNDETWQVTIKERICAARLIVLRASRPTESLQWEIETVLANAAPDRFLVFLPYEVEGDSYRHAEFNYDAFRAAVHDRFPNGLPEWQPKGMFVAFDADWGPQIVSGSNIRKTLREALRVQSGAQNGVGASLGARKGASPGDDRRSGA